MRNILRGMKIKPSCDKSRHEEENKKNEKKEGTTTKASIIEASVAKTR